MYYLMLVVSAALFSSQFLFYQRYQKRRGSSFENSLTFSVYSSSVSFVIMLFLNKFSIEVTPFSLTVAVGFAFVNILIGYCSIKAFETASLTVFSMFSMLGGMLLPFVYGIAFFKEPFTIPKIICCILIIISLFLVTDMGKSKKGALKYYFFVFVLNGLSGVFAKFHQSHTDICVNSQSYSALCSIATFVLCAIIFAVKYKSFPKITLKEGEIIAPYAFFNGMGNLLLLFAVRVLPASVQYPFVTGGVIVFSAIIGFLRKEKIKPLNVLSIFTALLATILLMF